MIEPYLAVSFPFDIFQSLMQFPKVGVGGGLQLGVKGGDMGAFFVDVNYMYFPDNVIMKNTNSSYPNPNQVEYRRTVLGLGIGYKIGFFTRN